MIRKRIAFIANSLENAYRFQHVLVDIGADVTSGSLAKTETIMKSGAAFDLVVFGAIGKAAMQLEEICSACESRGIPLLVIVDEEGLVGLSLPERVPSDFVVSGAGRAECAARVARLLGSSGSHSDDERIVVEDMVINLNTYQVTVGGEPVDMTYLEYALLAFFARNPGRAFTRDMLLQDVWGFDYFGGSRTVDVHVRRIRAKLGPALARHLETVRGVGYLWDPKS